MLVLNAPVCVHDVSHAIITDAGGLRPRPVSEGSAEMRAIPVEVALHDNGRTLVLDPTHLIVRPHMPFNDDPKRAIPVGPEQSAAFVFHVRLPAGYKLVREVEIAHEKISSSVELDTPAAEVSVDWRSPQSVGGMPDELKGLDPEIWKPNPDAVNRALREVFAKGKTNEGATASTKPEG